MNEGSPNQPHLTPQERWAARVLDANISAQTDVTDGNDIESRPLDVEQPRGALPAGHIALQADKWDV